MPLYCGSFATLECILLPLDRERLRIRLDPLTVNARPAPRTRLSCRRDPTLFELDELNMTPKHGAAPTIARVFTKLVVCGPVDIVYLAHFSPSPYTNFILNPALASLISTPFAVKICSTSSGVSGLSPLLTKTSFTARKTLALLAGSFGISRYIGYSFRIP